VNLGVAHGWAGALYAVLRWNKLSGQRPSAVTLRRLDELAEAGDRRGSGMRWAWRQRLPDGSITSGTMPGWCNGSAGLTMLWLEAHRVTGETRFLELGELAAWDGWAGRDDPASNLCCGLAGQAYAMFAIARATGDDAWLVRARRLVSQAVAVAAGEDGATPALFKGIGGLALVQLEAEDPLHARMPLFEAEGWPVTEGANA
jgi:serine/threonine-protein kinase